MGKKIIALGLLLFLSLQAWAPAEEASRIQDNSFLLEEAYNQEPGIVQHIQSFQRMNDRSWIYTFTQEWPLPNRTHQISYTIPYLGVTDPDDASGIGDIMLNYRYQYLLTPRAAIAPRISLLLPTGNYRTGLGSGSLGFQVNLPFSGFLTPRIETHWNAGATYTPGSKADNGATAAVMGYNLGASLVYHCSSRFNLMLEASWLSMEDVSPDSSKTKSETFLLSPGLRFAINRPSGLQIVPGLAFPTGIGQSLGENGVFYYLSLEHAFK